MAKITAVFSHPTDIFGPALIPVEVSNQSGSVVFREPIPLGNFSTLPYNFEPGTYLVRGTLPSGEVAAGMVDLREAASAQAFLRAQMALTVGKQILAGFGDCFMQANGGQYVLQ